MKKRKNKFKIKEFKELNWCREYDTIYEVYYGKKYLDSFRDDPKKLIKKFNKIIQSLSNSLTNSNQKGKYNYMANFENIFGSYFDAYKNTSRYKDDNMLEIALRKSEFEKNLDEMWAIYRSGNVKQVVEYQKGLDNIKSSGLKVYRNSDGKHKIVVPK